MLQFKDYRKRYGDTDILSISQTTLSSGIYWLRGGNGAGKSTLMRSIAGLIPYDGQIAVHGMDVRSSRRQYAFTVNHAEAEPQYPDFLTGDDLMRFYTEAKSAPADQAQELAERFGVNAFAGRKTGTYSSGMLKKLSLVLAFTGTPRLVLLDEPLITLDTESVAALLALIETQHLKGTSFVITSHQELTLETAKVQELMISNKSIAGV